MGEPLDKLAARTTVAAAGTQPLLGLWVDPRLQQPYQLQANLGWSHELSADTVISVDYVNSLGRDLNYKPRLNQHIPGTQINRISALLPSALSPRTRWIARRSAAARANTTR